MVSDIPPQIVLDRNLETANGILVREVLGNSAAETAGVKVDDIILTMDGIAMRDTSILTSYLGEHKSPGDTATLGLIRDNVNISLPLEIGERPS